MTVGRWPSSGSRHPPGRRDALPSSLPLEYTHSIPPHYGFPLRSPDHNATLNASARTFPPPLTMPPHFDGPFIFSSDTWAFPGRYNTISQNSPSSNASAFPRSPESYWGQPPFTTQIPNASSEHIPPPPAEVFYLPDDGAQASRWPLPYGYGPYGTGTYVPLQLAHHHSFSSQTMWMPEPHHEPQQGNNAPPQYTLTLYAEPQPLPPAHSQIQDERANGPLLYGSTLPSPPFESSARFSAESPGSRLPYGYAPDGAGSYAPPQLANQTTWMPEEHHERQHGIGDQHTSEHVPPPPAAAFYPSGEAAPRSPPEERHEPQRGIWDQHAPFPEDTRWRHADYAQYTSTLHAEPQSLSPTLEQSQDERSDGTLWRASTPSSPPFESSFRPSSSGAGAGSGWGVGASHPVHGTDGLGTRPERLASPSPARVDVGLNRTISPGTTNWGAHRPPSVATHLQSNAGVPRSAGTGGAAGRGKEEECAHWKSYSAEGRRKALLTGINYRGNARELEGCINDVLRMHEFLICHGGYTSRDIVLLTEDSDDPDRIPTRENMIRWMEWLVGGARPGDTLFLHFSGHGGQTPDLDGDEDDDMDETILPLDYETNGHILDDTLHDILVKPLPKGCRLTAVMDSCCSGTVLDLPFMYSSREDNRGLDLDVSVKGIHKASEADVVMFSGCRDTETSADTVENRLSIGALTYAFTDVLDENPTQTYQELFNVIGNKIKSKHGQKPLLSSSHLIDTTETFMY